METMNFGEEKNNSSATGRTNSRNKKLILAGIILAALILSVIGWQCWRYVHSTYYQQMKAVKALEDMEKESDKWGGKTPEETVVLFRDAVKKGDFELASKYGDPALIKPELEKMKSEGQIDQLIKWLENGELQEVSGFNGDDFNLVVRENNREIWIMSLFRSSGGTWKIVEF